MTRTELENFRQRLEQERTAIQAQITHLQEEFGGVAANTDEPSDEGDMAHDLISLQEDSAQIKLFRATLAQIEKALARIDAGTYGVSEVSGKPIPIERLEALPSATTLVDEPAPAA